MLCRFWVKTGQDNEKQTKPDLARQMLIRVYFDTTTQRFSRLIDKFWPKSLNLWLWNWDFYPVTA
jgi:hypothetical protein